jgi:hypothetical protein
MKAWSVAAAVVALAAGLGANSVFAGGHSATSASEDLATFPVAPLPVASVPADIAATFAIFREREATGMPADLAESMASPRRFGRNPALAREIATAEGPGWVVPGNGYVCLVVRDPQTDSEYGTSCNTLASARVRGVLAAVRDQDTGDGYATVLVPDGAEATLSPTTSGASRAGGELPSNDGVVSQQLTDEQDILVKTPGT